jgi:CDP-diacylglycerol--glycerol-3-phosphate 3-phosphatidyltransferase
LVIVYRLALPLAVTRVPPGLLTLTGLAAGAGAVGLVLLGGPWVVAAAIVVVLCGVLDGLDGAVAVLENRVTAWGGFLDSVVDRVVEVLFLVALWALGAPAWLCVLAGLLTYLLEYARARAGALGMADVGVVTVGERPSRVIVTAMFLVGAGLYEDRLWASLGAAVWAVLGVIACLQFGYAVFRRSVVDVRRGAGRSQD